MFGLGGGGGGGGISRFAFIALSDWFFHSINFLSNESSALDVRNSLKCPYRSLYT